MKFMYVFTLLMTVFMALPAAAGVIVGKPAPDFALPSHTGEVVKLSDYAGKVVLLEWTNPKCPYVKKFYDGGDMQALQSAYAEKDVVWLSINSGAEGRQGHLTVEEAAELVVDKKLGSTAYLLDHDGTVGRAYGAATTPHIYVIDVSGTLVYQGAIDSIPSADSKHIDEANNYAVAALDAVLAGKKVERPVSQPYGCSLKYAR